MWTNIFFAGVFIENLTPFFFKKVHFIASPMLRTPDFFSNICGMFSSKKITLGGSGSIFNLPMNDEVKSKGTF